MRFGVLGLALGLMATPALADETAVPEPQGLWKGPMHSMTPATLKGATVLDAAGLAKLRATAKPVMIDVANLTVRPQGMAEDMPWTPIHRSIPGATWMPGAGNGTDDPAFAAAFEKQVAKLTGGDRSRAVVAFCHPQRWGSWNTAKRIAGLGYKNVYWFPKGTEGWADDHDTEAVKESPDWKASIPAATAANSEREATGAR